MQVCELPRSSWHGLNWTGLLWTDTQRSLFAKIVGKHAFVEYDVKGNNKKCALFSGNRNDLKFL